MLAISVPIVNTQYSFHSLCNRPGLYLRRIGPLLLTLISGNTNTKCGTVFQKSPSVMVPKIHRSGHVRVLNFLSHFGTNEQALKQQLQDKLEQSVKHFPRVSGDCSRAFLKSSLFMFQRSFNSVNFRYIFSWTEMIFILGLFNGQLREMTLKLTLYDI